MNRKREGGSCGMRDRGKGEDKWEERGVLGRVRSEERGKREERGVGRVRSEEPWKERE